MRWLLATGLLLMVIVVPFMQGATSEWQNLAKIEPNDKVQVIDQHMRSYTGKFLSFSASGITLQTSDKGDVSIAKEDIYRVTVVSRGRGRHALRGLLFGAGVGAVIGGAVCASSSTKGERGSVIASTTLLSAGVGTLIGVAKQPHTPIYQTKHIRP